MIRRDNIRGGVEQRGDGKHVAWVSLRFEGEQVATDREACERAMEQMRTALLSHIYHDANQALSEMEWAVMSSLRIDADRNQIAAMFRKLRSTIAVDH